MNPVPALRPWLAAAALAAAATAAPAEPAPAREVYRCPGNPVLYTDALTPKEAREKGCRTLEGAPITIVQSVKPRPAPAEAASRPTGQRVDPEQQRARDNDARRILEDELHREEARLAELRQEYNGGQPERRGDERNYQKYLDRVAAMKADIQRKEGDVAALRREIAKLQ